MKNESTLLSDPRVSPECLAQVGRLLETYPSSVIRAALNFLEESPKSPEELGLGYSLEQRTNGDSASSWGLIEVLAGPMGRDNVS